MLFKCPCGFQNYLNGLPADLRVKCERCHKTWVVSKKGKKQRRQYHIIYLSLTVAMMLIPATWPFSPILLAALGARLPLLKQRYKPWIRSILIAVNAIIVALIAAAVFAIAIAFGQAIKSSGLGLGLPQYADSCLQLSVTLQQWSVAGVVLFAGLVVLIAGCQFIPKSKFGNSWDKWQEIIVRVAVALAALGLWIFLAQGSVSGLAATAEARLQDRYIAARESNERTARCITLLTNIDKTLRGNLSQENRTAFATQLEDATSAQDAVAAAERFLRAQGLASSSFATSRPAKNPGDTFDLVWQAQSRIRLRDEKYLTAQEETKSQTLNQQLAAATDQVTRALLSLIGKPTGTRTEQISDFFLQIVAFEVDHFPVSEFDQRQSEIAAAICSPAAAHELNVRETVSKLFIQAQVADTLESWQPGPTAPTSSIDHKTFSILNSSSESLRFLAVGPDVKEATIPGGTKRDISLQKGTYQAVLISASGMPTVIDMGYGVGHLKGEFNSQKAWRRVPDTDGG